MSEHTPTHLMRSEHYTKGSQESYDKYLQHRYKNVNRNTSKKNLVIKKIDVFKESE